MTLAAPYDARAVANLLLDFAEECSIELTQLSLLKLLYFAHGWYLASKDKPLVKQDFEAWQHGPVVKVVRDEFKHHVKAPISSRATKLNLATGLREPVDPIVSSDDYDFVRAIFHEYSGFSAWTLRNMTHEAGSPWDRLWNNSEPVGRFALRLRNEEIKQHFREVARGRFLLS